MSYRNPKIIDDKSGQVLGQAIAQGAQNLAKGVVGYEQERRKAIALEKKEAEDKLKKDQLETGNIVKIITDTNADIAAFNKRIIQDGIAFGDGVRKMYATVANDIGDIRMEGIRGATGQGHIEKVQVANQRKTKLDQMYTAVVSLLGTSDKMTDKGAAEIGNTFAFTNIGEGKENAAKNMIFGVNSMQGYGGYEIKENTPGEYTLEIKKPGGDPVSYTLADVLAVNDNPYTERATTLPGEIIKAAESQLLVQEGINKGKLNAKAIVGVAKEVTLTTNSGTKAVSRQNLNTAFINSNIASQTTSIFDRLDAANTTPQMQEMDLKDFNMTADTYNAIGKDSTPEQKRVLQEEAIRKEVQARYLKAIPGPPVQEKEGVFYQDTTISTTNTAEKNEQLSKVYKKYSDGIAKLNVTTTAADAVKEIIRFANLGEGATISRGSSNRFATKEITLNDNFIATITVGDGEGDYDSTQKYDLKKIEEAENFIRNKTGIYDPTQLDALATALSKKANSFSN